MKAQGTMRIEPDSSAYKTATVTVYPPESYVQLSDGSVGVVVKTNEHERMRPLLLLYEEGVFSQDRNLIGLDLTSHKELSIEKGLDPQKIDPQIRTVLTPNNLNGYFISSTLC